MSEETVLKPGGKAMPIPDLRAASFLTPPKKGDVDGNHRWQWAVAFKLWVLLLFALWAIGAFSAFGFDGFARAHDVHGLKREVREARITALESQIFELRLKQCNASGALRVSLAEQITRMGRVYYELTGANYQLPPCEDLQ